MENFYYKQIELELNKENINIDITTPSKHKDDVEHFKRSALASKSTPNNESKIRSSFRKLKTKLNKKINNDAAVNKGGLVNEGFKTSASNVKERFNVHQEPTGSNLVKSPFKNLDANQLRIVSKKFGENPFKSPPPPATQRQPEKNRAVDIHPGKSKNKVNFTKSNFKPYVKPVSPKPVLRDLRNRDFKKLNRNPSRDTFTREVTRHEIRKPVKYEIPNIPDELLENIKYANEHRLERDNFEEKHNDLYISHQNTPRPDRSNQAFTCKSHKSFELNISEIDSQISDLEKFRDQLIKWNKNYDSRDDLSIDYVPNDVEEFKVPCEKSIGLRKIKFSEEEVENNLEEAANIRFIDEDDSKDLKKKQNIGTSIENLSSRGSPDGEDSNRTYTLPLDLDNIDLTTTINIDDIEEIPNIDNCEIELENAGDYLNENEEKPRTVDEDIIEKMLTEDSGSELEEPEEKHEDLDDRYQTENNEHDLEHESYEDSSSNTTEMFKHINIYKKPITVLEPIMESPSKTSIPHNSKRVRSDCYFKTIKMNEDKYEPEKMFEIRKPTVVHYETPEDMFKVKPKKLNDKSADCVHSSLKRKRCTPRKKPTGIVNPSFNPVDQPLGNDNETFSMNESIGEENESFEEIEQVDKSKTKKPSEAQLSVGRISQTSRTNEDKFPIQLDSRGNHKNLESFLGFIPDGDTMHNTMEINYLPEGGIVNPNFDINDPQNFKRNVRFSDSVCILNETANSKKNKHKTELIPTTAQVPLKSNLKYKPEVRPFCEITSSVDENKSNTNNQVYNISDQQSTRGKPDAANMINGEFYVINTTNPFFSDILKQECSRSSQEEKKPRNKSNDLKRNLREEQNYKMFPLLDSGEVSENTKQNSCTELNSTYTVDDVHSSTNPFLETHKSVEKERDAGENSAQRKDNNYELQINTNMVPANYLCDLSDSLSPDTLKHVCLPLTYVPNIYTESQQNILKSQSGNFRKDQDFEIVPVSNSIRSSTKDNRKETHSFLSSNQDENFYPIQKTKENTPPMQHKDLKNFLGYEQNYFLDKQHDENFYKEKTSQQNAQENVAICEPTDDGGCNLIENENRAEEDGNHQDVEYEMFENFLKKNQSIEKSTHGINSFLDDSQILNTTDSKTFRCSTINLKYSKSEENLSNVGRENLEKFERRHRKKVIRKTLKRSSTQNNCRMNPITENLREVSKNDENIVNTNKQEATMTSRKTDRVLRRTKSLNENQTRTMSNRISRSHSNLRKSYSSSSQARKLVPLEKSKIKELKQHKENWKQFERRQFENFDINSIKVFKDFEEANEFEYIPVTSFYTNKNDANEYDVTHIVDKYNNVDCKECQHEDKVINESENSCTPSNKDAKQSQTNRRNKKTSKVSHKGLQIGKYNFMKLKHPSYKINKDKAKSRLNGSHNTTYQKRGSNKSRRSLRRLLKKYTYSEQNFEDMTSFNLSDNLICSPIGRYKVKTDSFCHDPVNPRPTMENTSGTNIINIVTPTNVQSRILYKQPIDCPSGTAPESNNANMAGISKRNPCGRVKNCDFLGDHTCEKIDQLDLDKPDVFNKRTPSQSTFSSNPDSESVEVVEKQIDRLSILINELRRNSYRGRNGNRRNNLWRPRYEDPEAISQEKSKSQTKPSDSDNIGKGVMTRNDNMGKGVMTPNDIPNDIAPITCQLPKSKSEEKIHNLDANAALKFKTSREKDHLNSSIIFYENPVYERRVKSEENVSATKSRTQNRQENYAKCDNPRKPRTSLGFEIERKGNRRGEGEAEIGKGREEGGRKQEAAVEKVLEGGRRGLAEVGGEGDRETVTGASGDNIITISISKEKRGKRTESSSSDGGGERGEPMEVGEGRQVPHRRKKMRHQIDIHLHALFAAVEHGHVDKTRTILESADVNVNR
ncbi:hypothetical protein M8J76_008215 [Diaphorina citri]|nr:hypothetical protein M8J76_008215 [Diaphorina citri]